MKLFLIDQQPDLIECWRREFEEFPEVAILLGDILAVASNSLVLPGNSWGLMDTGIARLYLEYFGKQIQYRVLIAINSCPGNYLPVGKSVMVYTGKRKLPNLIVSPTMLKPGPVNPKNSYQAMLATLRFAEKSPDTIKQVYCPGLGTGIGQVPVDAAARQMALAYRHWQQSR